MNIAIIGAGNMGSALTELLARAGHNVRITARNTSRAEAVAAASPRTVAAPSKDVARDADVVIIATGYADAIPALQSVGSLADKVVIDITNPLSADFMSLTVGHDTSAAEQIAKAIPGAHVVKAFNTLFAQVLAAGPAFADEEIAPVFYASDSERAKQTAKALIESTGFKPVDAGGLRNARYLEPLAGLNIYFGYGAGLGTKIAPTWIHKSADAEATT